jgi:hypothetical protein
MRDLGAHLSFSGGGASITLSARSGGAGLALDKIRLLPVRHKAKITLVRGKAYAMGLYGVEATPLNVANGGMLRSKAANAIIGRHQSMRAPEAVLALAGKWGLDICSEVLWRRTRLLRRAWHTRPAWRDSIAQSLGAVIRVLGWPEGPAEVPEDPADHLGARPETRPRGHRLPSALKKGPIGLLAASVVGIGGRLREGFLLDVPGEVTLDLLRDPIQRLRGRMARI